MLPQFDWFGLNRISSGRRNEFRSGQNIEQLDNLT
jgi:hypothetical protein